MEARLRTLEQSVARIEATLPTLATKDELHKGFSDMVRWIVGTAVAMGAVSLTVMTFVLNNAVPKAAQAAAPVPVIINVPAAPAATPAPQPKR